MIKKLATFTKIFSKNCCNLQKYMVQCILPVKKGVIMPTCNRLICDDTGGGCARRRKFPWSMSDFQTGRLCNTAQGGGVCALTGLLRYLCGENFCNSVRDNLRISRIKKSEGANNPAPCRNFQTAQPAKFLRRH